ncbi:MAG: acetyl ornithine aminotransferase family protein [Fimbriiglobus sp.]|jgi:4-aminobutyrate aminotransferase|nr:acetyl ornithine aminotransferase family protein [Fimbriiglobus sp.]
MFAFDHLPVPHITTPLPGPVAADLLARDTVFVSGSYTRVYPLVVDRGSGCVIEDVDGNRYLDFTAGIAVTNVGHCHPEVVAAVQDQAAKLIHMSGTDFYYRPQIELAERLAKLAPGPSAKKVFFCNSGAEAVEAAIKLARWHTERSRVVAFFGAFHGRTYGAMSLSGSKLVHRRGFSPLVPDVHHVAFPKDCPGTCDNRRKGACSLISDLETTIFKRIAPPEEVAAIFVEPIQGEGGYHPLPAGCLPALREICDKHGILLVVDEIQSGMGRTGKLWATEHFGVEPDIVCSAKGIASGLPLGAIIAKAEVMDWPPGSHASTFGGNPVACRAALTTLDLLEGGYTANAAERGEQLREGLRQLPGISHIRGLGLMTAADLPSATVREKVIDGCFRRGLLLLGCGETALRFCPALCVTAEQVNTCLRILTDILVEAVAA